MASPPVPCSRPRLWWVKRLDGNILKKMTAKIKEKGDYSLFAEYFLEYRW